MLISRTDIAQYRQISKTVNVDILNQNILDAEFVDLQGLIGSDFYNDILRNISTYSDLLDGSTYTYSGITYTNVGLKAVLSYYSYARYIMFGSQVDTPFSYVEKLNGQTSQPVSNDSKKTMFKMNQQIAFTYWENVQSFLNRNATTYPLWKNNCNLKTGNFRISKIG